MIEVRDFKHSHAILEDSFESIIYHSYRFDSSDNMEYALFLISGGRELEQSENLHLGAPVDILDIVKQIQDNSEYDFRMGSCCHGIVCFKIFSAAQMIIGLWNLATKEYTNLPFPGSKPRLHDSFAAFGFDPKSLDYKVLGVINFQDQKLTQVSLYSLKHDEWKCMEIQLQSKWDCKEIYGKGKYFRAKHFCFGRTYLEDAKSFLYVMLTFDLREITFETISLPLDCRDLPAEIDIIGDKVAYIEANSNPYDVWVLDENCIAKTSWTRMYFVESSSFGPILILRNGKSALVGAPAGLVLISLATRDLKLLKGTGVGEDTDGFDLCKLSLVSLGEIKGSEV